MIRTNNQRLAPVQPDYLALVEQQDVALLVGVGVQPISRAQVADTGSNPVCDQLEQPFVREGGQSGVIAFGT